MSEGTGDRQGLEDWVDESVDPQMTTKVTRSSGDEKATAILRDKWEYHLDEPKGLPHGTSNDAHPCPADHAVLALVGCQVEVLSQGLEKARIPDYSIKATAKIDKWGVDEEGRAEEMPSNTSTRIRHINIDLDVTVPDGYEDRAGRVLEVYDTGCSIGQSYRSGIEYSPNTTLSVN